MDGRNAGTTPKAITDGKGKEEIFSKVGRLKSIVGSPDNTLWTPFRISKGRAYFWTMQINLEKPVFIEFAPGS